MGAIYEFITMKQALLKDQAASAATTSTIPTCEPFPHEGNVRAGPSAKHVGIGVSTWWLYVKQGRIKQPMRYGKRVSVWGAAYVRGLAENGIPEAKSLEVSK